MTIKYQLGYSWTAMPLLEDVEPVTATRAAVETSVPVELFWTVHAISTGRHYRELPALARVPPDLRDRLRAVWTDDGPSCFGEALIIAEKQGVLFTPAIDDLVAGLR